eukprot:379775-Rhodomonas_salina.2
MTSFRRYAIAAASGVQPVRLLLLRSHRAAIRRCATWMCPRAIAHRSGVLALAPGGVWSELPPAAIRQLTAALCPLYAAMNSGVMPLSSTWSTLHFAASK